MQMCLQHDWQKLFNLMTKYKFLISNKMSNNKSSFQSIMKKAYKKLYAEDQILLKEEYQINASGRLLNICAFLFYLTLDSFFVAIAFLLRRVKIRILKFFTLLSFNSLFCSGLSIIRNTKKSFKIVVLHTSIIISIS